MNKNELEIYRGSVYLARLPYTDSSITRGTKEVVVISNNSNNRNSTIVQIIPLGFCPKKNLPTHYEFPYFNKVATAMAENLMCIPKENLFRYVCDLEPEDMYQIEKCVGIQLGVRR